MCLRALGCEWGVTHVPHPKLNQTLSNQTLMLILMNREITPQCMSHRLPRRLQVALKELQQRLQRVRLVVGHVVQFIRVGIEVEEHRLFAVGAGVQVVRVEDQPAVERVRLRPEALLHIALVRVRVRVRVGVRVRVRVRIRVRVRVRVSPCTK